MLLSELQYVTDLVVSGGRPAAMEDQEEAADFSWAGGSPIFSKPSIINIDNVGLYFEEEEKGVFQFGNLTSFGRPGADDGGMYFDGVGVRVFSAGELDLTA